MGSSWTPPNLERGHIMSVIPSQTFNGRSIPDTNFEFGLKIVNYRSNSSSVTPLRLRATFGNGYGATMHQSSELFTLFASSESFSVIREYNPDQGNQYSYTDSCQSWTYQNQTVYYYMGAWTDRSFYLEPAVLNDPYSVSPRVIMHELAYLMIYGGYGGFSVTYDLSNCTGDPGNPANILPNSAVTNMSFILDSGYAFNSGSCRIDGDGFPHGTPIQYVFEPETGNLKVGVITSDIIIHITAYGDPYQTIDGESEIPGGDTIPLPSLPTLSAVTSGIVGLFNPTIPQMQLLADYMWTDFGGTGSTTEDILKEIVQALKRSISNPLDYVIGLNIIPSAGLSVGASTTIRFGFVSSNVSMPRLTSQYFVVDCGTLSFSALCGDTFLDYAPYSKFSIYLPYIGVKDVDANDFVGHTIGVIYHGDVVTGGITAYVTKDGSVMYQYSGCCALNIPLTADNWGNTISGAVQIATALVTGGITGGSAGVASSAVKSVSSVAANPSLLSPQVSRSGAVSGGAGCMAVQKPFVIREAVRFHSTSGFNTVSGYPSYYFKALSEMHGYTVCYDVHLMGIPATDNEIDEIYRLLKEGVIL